MKYKDIIRYSKILNGENQKEVKKLEELQIIEWVGTNINDPKKRYILKQ